MKNGNKEVVVALMGIVVVLLVLGAGIAVAVRFRSDGASGTGILLEGIALLSMVSVLAAGVVAPLVRLANRTYTASHESGRLTWQVDDLPVTLNDAGVAAVYEPGRTAADGRVQISDGVSTADLLDPQTTALARFDHPGWVDFMATTGSTVLSSLVVVAAVFFLWRVVRTIRLGSPFDPANARRLYTVGILFLAGAALAWVGSFFAFVALGPLSDHVDWSVEMSFGQVVLGLVVVMVAEVFRQGIKLRRDTEGLV